MCGIVGYISKFDGSFRAEREKFFIEALVMDTLRGWDSTGIIHVHDQFSVGSMRAVQPGPQFVRNKRFTTADTNGWAAIGHNRAATHGAVKQANAHPFRCGDVTLVHNGTVRNKGSNMPKQDKRIEVDSHVVALNLAAVAPEKAGDVLKLIDGAYALAWTDARDESINFVRNGQRPLHFGVNKAGTIMYFMSEDGMLRAVSDRMRNMAAQIENVYSLDTYKLVKFKKGSLVPEVTSIDPFVRPRSSDHSGRRVWRGNENNAWNEIREEIKRNRSAGSSSRTTTRGSTDGSTVLSINDYMARKIPKAHRDWLEDQYLLKPSHRVSFSPTRLVPWSATSGMMLGTFNNPEWGDCEWEGVIYNVNIDRIRRAAPGSTWTCQPIGMAPSNLPHSSSTMPIPMLRLLDFNYQPTVEEEEIVEENSEMYPGPGGKPIFLEAFLAYCQYGCSYCQGNLDEGDADEIEWVGANSDQPLCITCQDAMTDPDDTDKGLIYH